MASAVRISFPGEAKSLSPDWGARLVACLTIGLCFFILHIAAWRAWAADSDSPLKIGVLAIRGAQQCLDSWTPTAEYLSYKIPGRDFVIVPLTHEAVNDEVEKGRVDFILANSAFYVGLEHWFGANRIATMKEQRGGQVFTKYGGVIFCRRDRTDIRTLADLAGKSFMAVSESSLGGWLMARRELQENGIDPYRDFGALIFGENHDTVVSAVRDGVVDAGTVRTNTLEVLIAEGRIDPSDFFVFAPLHAAQRHTPYFCTTREYPCWPMAKVRHTPDDLAEQVAVALLQMPADSPAAVASGTVGWTIPLNYQPVHDCLRALKIGPYKDSGIITVGDVMRSYGHWVVVIGAAFAVLTAFTAVVLKLNRKANMSIELHKQKDRELQQAKEQAESATRAKSEFLANMSHEIRTPMNGVIAATELALGDEVPPKIEHYLKIIHGSAYSLLDIINDILDFSKIEAGKFELKERVFRLNEVLDRVMELFVNKAAEKGIEILVDIDPHIPKALKGDSLRLKQILTNLVSNAIKFTGTGGVILLTVRRMDEAGVGGIDPSKAREMDEQAQRLPDAAACDLLLFFSVKDNGLGIAPEHKALIFEPFSQADASSTRKHEGTGLGLSICKQLVTMMGGQIDVQSEPGKGSTFFFTVRLLRLADLPAQDLVVPPDLQGAHALVVDDLADSRTIMRKMLTSLGFSVETIASGAEALARLENDTLRNNPIELIMMDWRMPGMDGIEVAKKIRREMGLTVPIIMMTAYGKEAERAAAEQAGINGFLIKPIYPSTLFDAIMDAFGKEGFKGPARQQRFTTRASMYRAPLKGIRVLVAEDNPTNQQVAQAILAGAEIAVTIANNGEEAVRAVAGGSFDAVLMDVQMPNMNGYEATRQIRRLPHGASIPIVAMTAHAMKGDEEKCLEAGMDGYISKPVNQDRLFATLWRLLRTRTPSGAISPEADRAGGAGGAGDFDGEDSGVFTAPPHLHPDRHGYANGQVHWAAAHPQDAAGAAQAPPLFLPSHLPGIDIAGTQAALAIDGTTYERILVGFGADNTDAATRIRQALARRDREQLLQLAHSLKGSAANIGAHALCSAAADLEVACRESLPANGSLPQIESLVYNLQTALRQVLDSIRRLAGAAPTPEQTTGAVAPNGPSFAEHLQALAAAIETADPEQIAKALDALRKQAARGTLPSGGHLRMLENQLRRYDFDQAMATISEMGRTERSPS